MEGILLQAVGCTEDGKRRVWAMVLVPKDDGDGYQPFTWEGFKRVWPKGTTLGVPTDAFTVERFCDHFKVGTRKFYTDHDEAAQ